MGRWEVLGRDDREESIIRIHFTKIVVLNLKVKLIFFLKKKVTNPLSSEIFPGMCKRSFDTKFLG